MAGEELVSDSEKVCQPKSDIFQQASSVDTGASGDEFPAARPTWGV